MSGIETMIYTIPISAIADLECSIENVLIFQDGYCNQIDENELNILDYMDRWLTAVVEKKFGITSIDTFADVSSEQVYEMVHTHMAQFEPEIVNLGLPIHFGKWFSVKTYDTFTYAINSIPEE